MLETDSKQLPTVNRVLFVTEESRQAIAGWPIELRAIFDPAADRALAEQIAERTQGQALPIGDDELPF